ncbi:MAG: hypothetical protein ACE5JA_04460, partial [bacterium]
MKLARCPLWLLEPGPNRSIWIIGLAAITLAFGSLAFAHDPGTHMYLGTHTIDVWMDFDPGFHQLMTTPSNWMVTYAWKMYYIGLTLPDMLDTSTQEDIESLVNELWDIRSHLTGPLEIRDHTHGEVQTRILFTDPPPNQNLEKLRLMAEWARANISWHFEKALIYGAYMHVIHDVYAHMILQPAKFGHGFAIESERALENDVLHHPEIYYELFTPTAITSWGFIKDKVYRGAFFTGGAEHPEIFGGRVREADWGYASLLNAYHENGAYISDWQDWDLAVVERFVQAANEVGYQTTGLTQERLESYMHGWAIAMFIGYGHRGDGSNAGGPVGHPGWTAQNIFDHVADMGDKYFVLCDIPILCDLFMNIIWDLFIKPALREFLREVIGYLPCGADPWPTHLETVQGIDDLWACVPPGERT